MELVTPAVALARSSSPPRVHHIEPQLGPRPRVVDPSILQAPRCPDVSGMTPGTPNQRIRHHRRSRRPSSAHWHRQRRHNSTASSQGAAARYPFALDHAPTPPNPILPQAWGYTGNTLPARAAIVRNTLTPVPDMPAEDVAQFSPGNYPYLAFAPDAPWFVNTSMLQAIEFALDYHVTESQAHRLWPRDPGPQTNGGTCAHHAPAGTGYRPHGARDPHLRLGPHHWRLATGGLHQPGVLLSHPPRLHVPRSTCAEVYSGETGRRALHHGLHRRGPGLCLFHAADGVADQVHRRLGAGDHHQQPTTSSPLAPRHVSAHSRTCLERLPTEVKGRERCGITN